MGDAVPSTSMSSNLGISPIMKPRNSIDPVKKSPNLVDETTSEDFTCVLHDNDITICPSEEDSDYFEEIGATSPNTSITNNGSSQFSETEVHSRPYVPFSTEEVSLVKSLDCWSNCNVRVIGSMSPTRINCNLWSLESVGEEGGPFCILVDIKLLMAVPPIDSPVQVFGEIQMMLNSVKPRPFILAKFYRDFSSVDLSYYCKALEELKKYVPHFIKKRKTSEH